MLEPDVFIPPVTALICNALWFISLGLSLSCALVATLLEQWAQDFLHRADMRSAPVIRARIFSFFYYGLKRFNMHVVVEVIPLLLHTSLIFFFAGLVAFLMPVNNAMVAITSILLALVVTVYFCVTILPLFYLDCPYRTPLSGAFWRLLQFSRALFAQQCNNGVSEGELGENPSDSVVEAVFCAAKTLSEERATRDCHALVWTVKSLADETELEPFVEGIHDVLWGPRGRRRHYDSYILALVSHPEVQLIARIEGLLRSADLGLLSKESATRRSITCLKALWAIASLAERGSPISASFDLDLIYPLALPTATDTRHYALSALTVARWATFCAMGVQLEDALHLLRQYDPAAPSDTMPVYRCLHDLRPIFEYNWTIERVGDRLRDVGVFPMDYYKVHRELEAIHSDGPYLILIEYLMGQLNFQPYEYESSRACLQYLRDPLPSGMLTDALNEALGKIPSIFHGMGTHEMSRVDDIAGFVASFFSHASDEEPFLWGLSRYLQNHRSLEARRSVAKSCAHGEALWSLMTTTLTNTTRTRDGFDPTIVQDTSVVLWHVVDAVISEDWNSRYRVGHVKTATYESILAVVESRYDKPAIVALLKTLVVESLLHTSLAEPEYTAVAELFSHPLLPSDTADIAYPSELNMYQLLHARVGEAIVSFLAELLETYGSGRLFGHAAATARASGSRIEREYNPHQHAVHASHQIRFAKGLGDILRNAERHTDSTEELLGIFAAKPSTDELAAPAYGWLDNATARTTINELLDEYLTRVCNPSNGTLDSELREKLENLIRGWTDTVAKGNHSSS